MSDTRGRYAQKIPWRLVDDRPDYAARPQDNEELWDFIDRWLNLARLPNGYIHPLDVQDLLIALSTADVWFDRQFGEYGGAALSSAEVEHLVETHSISIDELKEEVARRAK